MSSPHDIEEPTYEEFLKELNKYPRIRDNNYQALGQSNAVILNKKSENTANTITTRQNVSVDKTADFTTQLQMLLLQYFSESDVEKILAEFKKSHQQFISSLSLDAIERLASKLQQ